MNQQQFEINKRLVQQHIIYLNTSPLVDDLVKVYLKDYSSRFKEKIFKANRDHTKKQIVLYNKQNKKPKSNKLPPAPF